jgi:hypothetical protein
MHDMHSMPGVGVVHGMHDLYGRHGVRDIHDLHRKCRMHGMDCMHGMQYTLVTVVCMICTRHGICYL